MSSALGDILMVLAALALVPVSVLFAQAACAAFPQRPAPLPESRRPRLAVLVPAHNESAGIAGTLGSVLPQLERDDRLLVVADNCSDGTARLAAGAGAEVVERHDTLRRGKGYALDFGVRHLERDPPELVVIVDADCEVAAGAIERLARTGNASGRPVQALYLMKSPRGAGALTPIAEFAWLVKNLVRPLGFHRLGLPCQLGGSGMAIPWTVICRAQLANAHIVEDLKLGIDLTRTGTPPLFCPEALVVSAFPVNATGSASQRARWEHGHLATILGEAPGLFLYAIRLRRADAFALALDLCVPPLALLALIIAVLTAASAGLALLGGPLAPLGLAGAIGAMFAAAVGLSWLRYGTGIVSFGTLMLACVYAVRKIPLYFRFLTRRQAEWVRSRRD
jgi:cellulose synthase/poly-beta-1,6-N-acetylglucosamine synthase-like glycosyltransferase